jgi:hypothetical protein
MLVNDLQRRPKVWLNATTQSITEGLIDNSLARVLGCEPLPVMIPVIE